MINCAFVAGACCDAVPTDLYKNLAARVRAGGGEIAAVDGVRVVDGAAYSATVSDQAEGIVRVFDSFQQDRPNVIVTNSMGALAAVKYLEDASCPPAHAVLISPPLPRPFDILIHPTLRGRTEISRARVSMQSYSHPEGVFFPEDYADQIMELDASFMDRVGSLVDEGLANIVVGTQDWNEKCAPAAALLGSCVLYDTTHSFGHLDDAGFDSLYTFICAPQTLPSAA